MYFFINIKKALSIILIVTFIIQLNSTGTSLPVKNSINNTINTARGHVIETFKGTGSTKIYCIENLHCHKQASENICGIIKTLKERHKQNLKYLFTEGTDGYIDTSIINKIKDKYIQQELINYLLEKGDITAGELYALRNPGKILLYGVENFDLYIKNSESLFKIINNKQESDKIITRIQNVIEFGKSLIYPLRLKDLESIEQDFIQNKISLKEYIQYLAGIWHGTLSDEISNYLKLLKLPFNSIQYNNINKNINTLKLLSQVKSLAQMIKEDILQNMTHPKDLYICDKYIKLLKKYLKLNVSFNNITELHNTKDIFYKSAKYVLYKIVEKKSLEKELKKLENLQKEADNFYNLADKRSEIMSQNMLNKLQKNNSSLVISNYNYPCGIIVAGGYHTKVITKILRTRGISYEVIRPYVSDAYDKKLYLSKLEEQSAWFSRHNNCPAQINLAAKANFIEIYSRIKMVSQLNIKDKHIEDLVKFTTELVNNRFKGTKKLEIYKRLINLACKINALSIKEFKNTFVITNPANNKLLVFKYKLNKKGIHIERNKKEENFRPAYNRVFACLNDIKTSESNKEHISKHIGNLVSSIEHLNHVILNEYILIKKAKHITFKTYSKVLKQFYNKLQSLEIIDNANRLNEEKILTIKVNFKKKTILKEHYYKQGAKIYPAPGITIIDEYEDPPYFFDFRNNIPHFLKDKENKERFIIYCLKK
ncbi:hypothetical protein ACFL4O_04065, partial [bacterium]